MIEGVRSFSDMTEDFDQKERNVLRGRAMTATVQAVRPGFVGRHLRATELPRSPGWAVLGSSRAFDGTPIYVQAEDIRFGLVTRDKEA